MTKLTSRVFLLFLCGSFLFVSPAVPCSTLMLSRDDCLVVGHNLDQSFYTPGMIHVNPRSESKRSVSGFDLDLTDVETPIIEWTSRYGSVTFSLLGRNLPDGGINEAGLTVNEMALGDSVFSFDVAHHPGSNDELLYVSVDLYQYILGKEKKTNSANVFWEGLKERAEKKMNQAMENTEENNEELAAISDAARPE